MIFDLIMVRILDNSPEKRVIDAIRELIKDSKIVNFAVGYFYLNGWNLIEDDLPENLPEDFIKILIGRELDFPTFKEIKKGYKLRIKTKLLDDLSEIREGDTIKIRELYNLIKNKNVDFKIYTESKLHSKLYLFIDNPSNLSPTKIGSPGTAILGSSNFTIPGTLTSRELNTAFTNAEAVKELQIWFKDLWDYHSEEFTEDLIKIINASRVLEKNEKNPIGKYISPQTLFKYLTWIWLRGKIEPIEKEDILAQFQLVGVLNAIEIISDLNGVIIADSVGLGKSFIGATIIEEYITGKIPEWDPVTKGINKIKKVLLVLPPSLIKQWSVLIFKSGDFFSKNTYKENSEDNRFLKYDVIGDTSQGTRKIGEVHFLSLGKFGLMSKEQIYSNNFHKEYDLILIDEAHKFRNRMTKRWNNSQALRFKEKDNPNSFRNKFILLTATPINNNIWDVYNLIKIFSDDNFTNFKKRNVQISRLFTEYKNLKLKWKEDKKQEGNLSLKAQEIKDNVFKRALILRTRKYIMAQFGKNGKIYIRDKEYSFQDPIPDKVDYRNVDKKFKPYNDFIDTLEDLFEDLEFSFTKLYSSGFVAFSTDHIPEEGQEEERFMIPIGAILKFLLAKRLESSIFGFERTLVKLAIKNNYYFDLMSRIVNESKILAGEHFFDKMKEFSKECISIAGKEDIVQEFEEDDIEIEGGRSDPRLRMIQNLISNGNPILYNEIKEYFNQEKEFYEYCSETSNQDYLINAIRSGLELLFLELKKDKIAMEKIIKSINNIKIFYDNGEIDIVGDFTSEGQRVNIPKYSDPKFQKLKDLMYNELNSKKYIIFTQYRDTAKYLFESLKNWVKNQKNTLPYLFDIDRLKIEIVTGELDLKQKEKIIERFAPYANNSEKYINKSDIEILISTDSLSEGVNLQDADGVINYDLPWNPMKIVQRVGRVNRIGNEKDIFIKNFNPAKEVEAIIGILEKLNSKIKDITFLVGKEFYILSEDEDITTETFEKKILNLADASMSELEALSQTSDAKIIGDIVHQEEIDKFKLLNFIQNEIKLRKKDYDDIQQFLGNEQTFYTLTESPNTFRVYESYRGGTRSGQYILKFNEEGISESTCKEFIDLWYSKELEKDFNIENISIKNQELDEHFKKEIFEKQKGMSVQRGFLKKLFVFLKNLKQQKRINDTQIDYKKVIDLINFIPLVEMTTREIGEFKKHLVSNGAIKKSEEIIDLTKIVNYSYTFLKPSTEADRKLRYKVLGWRA